MTPLAFGPLDKGGNMFAVKVLCFLYRVTYRLIHHGSDVPTVFYELNLKKPLVIVLLLLNVRFQLQTH